ncbi:MAG: hypothetical protein EA415_12595 [Sphaerobacteraceae bacterium]|nr:MAG: hypothetical protein EA415_12595 [Sphaerobacteraceae bacterium]
MPTNRRWMLALFVLACVIAAPMHAPGAGFADEPHDVVSESNSLDRDPADPFWDGYLFPGDEVVHAGWFSRYRAGGYLPDPDEYVARLGAGLDTGGGEPFDYSLLIADGSRVFPLARGSFRISQEFGCVPFDPGYSQPDFCPPDRPSFHHGVDFAAPEGEIIYAAATGVVNFAEIDKSNDAGNSVIRIIHDGVNSGYATEYFHWRKSFVEAGDYVIAGEPIGEIGSVGYSSGPHLHFGVFDSGAAEYIDPMDWLIESESLQIAVSTGGVGGGDGVMQWATLIREASDRYGIPAGLIAAIITVESSGNPEAVSPVGAQGLMQVMPMHLERYEIPANKWRDPATNIDAGTRLLSELVAQYGTLTGAVGAYFGHGCDVLGTCTEDYIAAVFTWFSHYVPIFGDVALDASEFEVPAPNGDHSANNDYGSASPSQGVPASQSPAAPAPSPTPKPTPTVPAASSQPVTPSLTPPVYDPPATPPASESPVDDQSDDQVAEEPTPTVPAPEPEPTAEPVPTTEPEPTPVPTEEPSDDGDEIPDDAHGLADTQTVEAFESLWTIDPDAGVVLRESLEDSPLIAMISVNAEPWAIAATEEHIWVVSGASQTAQRIDVMTNEVDLTVEFDASPVGIVNAEQEIWIVLSDTQKLARLDLDSLELSGHIELSGEPCNLWFDESTREFVVKICDQDEPVIVPLPEDPE